MNDDDPATHVLGLDRSSAVERAVSCVPAHPPASAARPESGAGPEHGSPFEISVSVRSIGKVLFGTTALVTLADVAAQLVRYAWGPSRLTAFFSLNAELNLPALYSGLLLLCACVLALIVGASSRTSGRPWLLMSAVLGFLCVDEVFVIHERLNPLVRSLVDGLLPQSLLFVWMIPYLMLAGIVVIVLFPFVLSLHSRVRDLVLLSGVVYVAGAAGMEVVEGLVLSVQGDTLGRHLVVALEEGMEMTGVCLLIVALLIHLRHRPGNLEFDLVR